MRGIHLSFATLPRKSANQHDRDRRRNVVSRRFERPEHRHVQRATSTSLRLFLAGNDVFGFDAELVEFVAMIVTVFAFPFDHRYGTEIGNQGAPA